MARKCVCDNCGQRPNHYLSRGLCSTCYAYWRRCGVMRPLGRHLGTCRDCRQADATGDKLCAACYQYRRRKGRKRPAYLYTEACTNCRRPRSDEWMPRFGRCNRCYRHWKKYGRERVVPLERWCDCSHVATHYDIRLPVQNGASGKITTVTMDLCEDCYELEFGK